MSPKIPAYIACPPLLNIHKKLSAKRSVPSLLLPSAEIDLDAAGKDLAGQLSEKPAEIPQEVVVTRGETWTELSSFMQENHILLGSVAETVFRQCECPVLTVDPKAATHLDLPAEPKEILCATDFSPEAKAAAAYAVSLAQEHQARLVLLHVIEPPKASELAHGDEFVSATMELLRDLVPREAELGCKPEHIVEYGSPADSILKVAGQKQAHLIVLGVRKPEGNIGLATHFARATASKVVSQANCPVLTVRG